MSLTSTGNVTVIDTKRGIAPRPGAPDAAVAAHLKQLQDKASGRDAHGQGPLRGLARQRRGVEQECGNRAAQHSSARFPRDSQVLSSAAFGGWLYISTA